VRGAVFRMAPRENRLLRVAFFVSARNRWRARLSCDDEATPVPRDFAARSGRSDPGLRPIRGGMGSIRFGPCSIGCGWGPSALRAPSDSVQHGARFAFAVVWSDAARAQCSSGPRLVRSSAGPMPFGPSCDPVQHGPDVPQASSGPVKPTVRCSSGPGPMRSSRGPIDISRRASSYACRPIAIAPPSARLHTLVRLASHRRPD